MSLDGRTALVTGASRGIGAAIARRLAAAGTRLALCARNEEALEPLAGELAAGGTEVLTAACDVGDEAAVAALAAQIQERFGDLDVLINNAGVASSAPLARIELAEWDRLLRVNATGTFLCCRQFIPGMVERGWGRVVQVASVAGLEGAPYIAAYTAAKHAVVGLTRALAREVGSRGVTVNAVCPGYVDTPMTDQTVAHIVEHTGRSAEAAREILAGASPQYRLMEPAEVAWLAVALCAPEAAGINGQALILDGGAVQR